MTEPDISAIAPLFNVKNVPAALSSYRDRLAFDITFQGPDPHDIFFGIVQRGRAMMMIMFKDVGVNPLPNYKRDVNKGIARWDAYLHACAFACGGLSDARVHGKSLRWMSLAEPQRLKRLDLSAH